MPHPTAQRQTEETNRFVQIGWLEIATASVRTGFTMTNGVACYVIARLAEQAVAISIQNLCAERTPVARGIPDALYNPFAKANTTAIHP